MKFIALVIAVSAISLTSCSQDVATNKVPSVVQNSLSARFANAGDIDWKKTASGYEAEFKINKTEHSAYIDNSGKFLYSSIEIADTEVPENVKAAALAKHPGFKIDDVEKLDRDGQVAYEVELEMKGSKDIKVIVLPDGTISENFIANK